MKYLTPCERHASIKDIDFEKLHRMGIISLIFDIDNTLVPDGADSTPEIKTLISELKKQFRICLLSNNELARVKPFAESLDVDYICHARKPSPDGYKTAIKTMKTDAVHSCMIGDQLFTDIYGANKLNIYSILVTPISKKEPFAVRIKRIPEKIAIALINNEARLS